MTRIAAQVIFASAFVAFFLGAAQADISGKWKTQKGKNGGYGIVEVYSCGAAYCGKLVDVLETDNRESIGKLIIRDMTSKNGKSFSGGKVYAVDEKKTYRGKLKVLGPSKLKVSGCLPIGFPCRGQVWTRYGN